MAERIAIGSDHRGFRLKAELVRVLKGRGFDVNDCGTGSEDACDYPDYGIQVAEAVQSGRCSRGIVICHSGIGMSIAANKVRGVRASLCLNEDSARMAREHNNANVLALGAGFLDPEKARQICLTWLDAGFEGGRHERRVGKISAYEQKP
jgi:ribose 5-phosphate isomerase B